MKKRILALATAFCIAITMFPLGAITANADTKITDDKVYYISDYSSGDCVLSANVCMMRRAAILRDCSWEGIKNNSARKKLCFAYNCMNRDYVYKKGNLTFYGEHGFLPGGYDANKAKIIKLLKKHPEGIVVHGYDCYGTHGILITSYKNGVFYCYDSAQNYGGRNIGIVTFGSTSLRSLGGCFQYWCLSKVKFDEYTVKYSDGVEKAIPKQIKIPNGKLKSGVFGTITKQKFVREGYRYDNWYIYKFEKGDKYFLCRNKDGNLKWAKASAIPKSYDKLLLKSGGKIKLNMDDGDTIYLTPNWIKSTKKLDVIEEIFEQDEVFEEDEFLEEAEIFDENKILEENKKLA